MVETPSSLGDRRTYLGASDIAAVLGLDPYRTPLRVWTEKVADIPLTPQTNEDIERGILLEPVVAIMAARRLHLMLEDGGEFPLQGTPVVVHPDRLHVSGLVECKAPGRFKNGVWGEDGTDDAPQQYLVQVQVQALALHAAGRSVEHNWLAAHCGHLRTYPIAFSMDTARRIVDYADAWWSRHVLGGLPPPAQSLVELNDIVARKPMVAVGDDLVARLRRLKTFRKIEARAKALGEVEKQEILATLAKGDGALPEAIAGPGGEEVGGVKRGGRRHLDEAGLRRAHPEIAEQFTKRIEWNELRLTKHVDILPLTETPLLSAEEHDE